MLLAGLVLVVPCRSDEKIFTEKERGRAMWSASLEKRMPTSAEQWTYARETQNKGHLKRADRRMLYLVRRWPNSKEAPRAARARADILLARGKRLDAFSAYQFLIDNYSSRMDDYDSVLESQFSVAVAEMNRRRMRWLFGGYRAPEYAVHYFEDVIRNGPQWARAAEAQFMIGQCHQDAKEYELAILGYGVLGYHYPESAFAEEGAWQQITCLDKQRKEFPDSPEILDRILTASTVFLSTYPPSERRGEVIQLRNTLYEVKAQRVFNEAAFYAKVPKEPKAAILYYESLIEEYPKSKMVPRAEERIATLKELMAMPEQADGPVAPRSRPLPFLGKGSRHAEG